MKNKIISILLVLSYPAIVFATIAVTSPTTYVHLFDRFIVRQSSIVLSCTSDCLSFYTKIFDLPTPTPNSVNFGGNSLIIAPKELASPGIEISFVVKNRFSSFHAALKKRFSEYRGQKGSATISEIQKEEGKIFFILLDPAGNILRFTKKGQFN